MGGATVRVNWDGCPLITFFIQNHDKQMGYLFAVAGPRAPDSRNTHTQLIGDRFKGFVGCAGSTSALYFSASAKLRAKFSGSFGRPFFPNRRFASSRYGAIVLQTLRQVYCRRSHPARKFSDRAIEVVALQYRVSKWPKVTFQVHPAKNYKGSRVFCGALAVGDYACRFELPRDRSEPFSIMTGLRSGTTALVPAPRPLAPPSRQPPHRQP